MSSTAYVWVYVSTTAIVSPPSLPLRPSNLHILYQMSLAGRWHWRTNKNERVSSERSCEIHRTQTLKSLQCEDNITSSLYSRWLYASGQYESSVGLIMISRKFQVCVGTVCTMVAEFWDKPSKDTKKRKKKGNDFKSVACERGSGTLTRWYQWGLG